MVRISLYTIYRRLICPISECKLDWQILYSKLMDCQCVPLMINRCLPFTPNTFDVWRSTSSVSLKHRQCLALLQQVYSYIANVWHSTPSAYLLHTGPYYRKGHFGEIFEIFSLIRNQCLPFTPNTSLNAMPMSSFLTASVLFMYRRRLAFYLKCVS